MAKLVSLVMSLLSLVLIPGLTGAQTKSSDFDANGQVDFEDFFLFAEAFGSRTPADLVRFDLSNNGTVDFDDFFLFVADFRKTLQPPRIPYIDEPILLKASEPASPIQAAQGEFIFDLSNDPLIQKGECNDFEVTYVTIDQCDRNTWMFNYTTQSWDQIGFDPGYDICGEFASTQGHLFSARGFKVQNYWNEKFQMRLKGIGDPRMWFKGVSDPKLRALRINPEYFAIPAPYSPNKLAYDGQSLWASSSGSQKLYNVSLSGALLKELAALLSGLTYDGQNLWVAEWVAGAYRIAKWTRNGDVLCQFPTPIGHPRGLTWGASKLWLAGYDSPYEGANLVLLGIDPDASCRSRKAVITDSLRFSGTGADTLRPSGGGWLGFAWDGTHFLITTNKLYKLSTSGVVARYDLPVWGVSDVTWDGENVWVLNDGPKGVRGYGPVISAFRLR